MIVELPGIIINKALGIDGNEPTVSIMEIYENLSETVSDIVHSIQPLPFLQTIPTPERYSAECWNRGMRSRH